MKGIIRSLIISLAFFGLFGVAYATPAGATQFGTFAASASHDDVCAGISGAGGGCSGNAGKIDPFIKNAVNVFSVILGMIAVFMIVVAGIKYTTSGGDSSKVASAKMTLIYAIVGIIVAATAQFIVKFLIHETKL